MLGSSVCAGVFAVVVVVVVVVVVIVVVIGGSVFAGRSPLVVSA